jgi:hypothetical protein
MSEAQQLTKDNRAFRAYAVMRAARYLERALPRR